MPGRSYNLTVSLAVLRGVVWWYKVSFWLPGNPSLLHALRPGDVSPEYSLGCFHPRPHSRTHTPQPTPGRLGHLRLETTEDHTLSSPAEHIVAHLLSPLHVPSMFPSKTAADNKTRQGRCVPFNAPDGCNFFFLHTRSRMFSS